MNNAVSKDFHGEIDKLQVTMEALTQVECPLVHRFTPGIYVREIFMPKGALIVSKIHKTEHPFTISKGRVRVLIPGEGVVELSAPYTGVTKPGTRRVLYILEDCVWTTYHPTDKTTPEEVEEDIIEKRDLSSVRETMKIAFTLKEETV